MTERPPAGRVRKGRSAAKPTLLFTTLLLWVAAAAGDGLQPSQPAPGPGTAEASTGNSNSTPTDCQADDPSGVPMRVRRLQGVPFDWITDDLELAITERNFRITGRNTIGKALRERGYEGHPDSEVIHFCNLENARAVLALDPGFIAQMPCRVTVHAEGEEVVVSMLLLPETHADARVVAFARELNAQLCAIQDYVVERD